MVFGHVNLRPLRASVVGLSTPHAIRSCGAISMNILSEMIGQDGSTLAITPPMGAYFGTPFTHAVPVHWHSAMNLTLLVHSAVASRLVKANNSMAILAGY